ncbi:Ankyrin repeat-containing domain protein [Rutstroemia sp. NJR-2017a BVV2]|nr:Ankyrin repeat-containing domain protein [Rutstroemia sp. NJR-2017a BVV2]
MGKVRILCLDGGGVKGVTSLRILQSIMEQISIEEHERAGSDQPRSEEPLKPCDYFDLICGTGTGGLIAILLGRLEYTLEEAIKKYEEFGEKIFSKKLSWFTRWDATYDHTVVEKLLKEVITESPLKLHEDAALKDASRPCKTFVITTKLDKHSSSPILMRSYDLDEDKESSIKIWEAGDGGTIANNPSHHAIMEAAKIWKLDDIGCIVSLGTGPAGEHTLDDATEEILGSWGKAICQKILSQSLYYRLQLAFYSLQAMTSTERTHLKTKEMVDVFRRMRIKNSEVVEAAVDEVYYRLNLTYKEAKVGLDAWQKMGLATQYMKTDIVALSAKIAIAKQLATTAKQRLPPLWIAPEDPMHVLELYILSCLEESHIRFYKLARIDNTAKNNFISKKFADQLGLSKMDVVAHEKTVFINLTIGNDKNMHIGTFFVVNDDDMQADIMVGFEFTMNHKAFGRNVTAEERKNLSQAKMGGVEAVRLPRNARKSGLKSINYSSPVPLILNGDNSWKNTPNTPLYGEIAGLPVYGEIVENIAFLDTKMPDGQTSATKIAHEAILEEVGAKDGNDEDEQPEDEKEGLDEKESLDEKDSSNPPPQSPSESDDDEDKREALLEELLKCEEFDIDEKDENGQTVLSQAAKDGDETLVKMLLKTGKVDVNAKDYSDRTALAVAARNGHLAVVKILLAAPEVDVASKDIYGETALSIAEKNGHEGIVELLR